MVERERHAPCNIAAFTLETSETTDEASAGELAELAFARPFPLRILLRVCRIN